MLQRVYFLILFLFNFIFFFSVFFFFGTRTCILNTFYCHSHTPHTHTFSTHTHTHTLTLTFLWCTAPSRPAATLRVGAFNLNCFAVSSSSFHNSRFSVLLLPLLFPPSPDHPLLHPLLLLLLCFLFLIFQVLRLNFLWLFLLSAHLLHVSR